MSSSGRLSRILLFLSWTTNLMTDRIKFLKSTQIIGESVMVALIKHLALSEASFPSVIRCVRIWLLDSWQIRITLVDFSANKAGDEQIEKVGRVGWLIPKSVNNAEERCEPLGFGILFARSRLKPHFAFRLISLCDTYRTDGDDRSGWLLLLLLVMCLCLGGLLLQCATDCIWSCREFYKKYRLNSQCH